MSHLNGKKMTKFKIGDMVIRDIRERSPGWCSRIGGDGSSILKVYRVAEDPGGPYLRFEGILGVWDAGKFNLVGLENE